MMARSSDAPSMGRIQKRKTNLSKSSLSVRRDPGYGAVVIRGGVEPVAQRGKLASNVVRRHPRFDTDKTGRQVREPRCDAPACDLLSQHDAAINSYDDFNRARSDGKIPSGTRFQVSLPTPIAVVMTFTEPDAPFNTSGRSTKSVSTTRSPRSQRPFRTGTLPSNGTLPLRYASSWKIRKW